MTDNGFTPLVSIGMPLFNEGRFLNEALEALINQDYPNIEIIISDNASTDATESICRAYAERDERIAYHRAHENEGSVANFNFVFKQACGKYFMWAAGHDFWSQNCISECVNMLETHPASVLAFPTTSWMDETSSPHQRETGWADTRGLDPIARYFMVFWGNMNPILGLIRKSCLDAAPMTEGVGADLVLLTKLILKGDFLHAAKAGWKRREFRNEATYQDKLKRYKSRDYKLAVSSFDRTFPLARLPVNLLIGVFKADIPMGTKLSLLLLLLPALPVKYFHARGQE